MGLDMYLSRKLYVKNWEHTQEERKSEVSVKIGGRNIELGTPTCIETEVAYWRKANAIHNWFVENVQDGEDDCKEYYVSESSLELLVETCKSVVALIESSPKIKKTIVTGWEYKNGDRSDIEEEVEVFLIPDTVRDILPTASGFFFGSTEYDEWYLQDIKYTIETISKAIKDKEESGVGWEFYYSSSW